MAHQLVALGYGPQRSVVKDVGARRAVGRRSAGAPPQSPAAALLAESGAAQGQLLPGAADPMWEAVPLHLHQRLRGPAEELVSPA
ncbi:hypothetical protein [Streptomyces cucumeris]|uniref:hypothetical protein n=1 Tax=Streptomyces cucumeris TaxID=2962890 RepID=UPI003D71558A